MYILLSPPDGTALLKVPAREIKDFLQGTSSPEDDGNQLFRTERLGRSRVPLHRALFARAPWGWHTEFVLPLMAAAVQDAFPSIPGAGVVSVCALIFTVASFWWINARQGHLKSWEPHSFAAIVHCSMARLRLPLVLHNTGAKPIVVQDLRLTFPDEPASHLPLLWISSPSRLQPGPEDEPKLPAGFAVAGREAQQLLVEFEAPFSGFVPEPRDYKVQLQAKVGHRKGWRSLVTFTLRAANIIDPDRYTVYSNAPLELTKEDRQKADAALLELLDGQEGFSAPGERKRRGSLNDEGDTGTNL
ncbi:hypothetical protein [Streptomyces mirabilis]|uniref:hypothetical protein n=1 Tax=Streptomyces mirabilis TaxID=68239 RepID=UPI0033BAEB2E